MAAKDWDFSYTWQIENFSSCPLIFGNEIRSQDFVIETLGISKWCLEIRVCNYDNDNECLSFSLLRRECELEKYPQITPFSVEIAVLTKELVLLGSLKKPFVEREDESDDALQLQSDNVRSDLLESYSDTLIMQCFIRKWNTTAIWQYLRHKSTEAQTKTAIDKCSFEWIVKFHDCYTEIKKCFILADSYYEITLDASHTNIAIYVNKLTNSSSFNLVHSEISLLDIMGNIEYFKTYDHKDNGTWYYTNFQTKMQFLSYFQRNAINGSFILLCEFSICKNINSVLNSIPNYDTIFGEECLLKLQCDLRNLFTSKSYCDVKFQINDVTLKAHKSVLIARSPVFAVMFTEETLENKTGIVYIVDVEVEILESFLEYIYTGVVSNMDYARAWKLLIVSDKYQVPLLMEKCSSYLISVLSTDNVVDVLLLADTIQYEPLKNSTLFYAVNYSGKIFASQQWLRIAKNTKLCAEIFSYIGRNFEIVSKVSMDEE